MGRRIYEILSQLLNFAEDKILTWVTQEDPEFADT